MGAHASAEARAVLDAVRRIVRLLRQSDRDAERKTGLSGAQLFVLEQLRAAGGTLTPGELSRRTLTHQSSVSGVVRRLSQAGHVRRVRSSTDARRIELQLTPAGRVAVRRAPPLAQQRLISAVDDLDASRRATLAHELSDLVRQLGIGVAPALMFFEEGDSVAE
jgi:DNA-binding MarR family transcriptional regulator